MAIASVPTWDLDPNLNGSLEGIPMFEGMQPAQLNDGVRAVMAAVRKEHDDQVAAIAAAIAALATVGKVFQTGDVKETFVIAPIVGWVLADGGTIGSGASGASNRANDDTGNLFSLLWLYPAAVSPMTTNAGAPTVRGANAAADFAAGNRLALWDLRSKFLRGADNGRGASGGHAVGTTQADAFQGHLFSLPGLRQIGFGASYAGGAAGDNVAGVYQTGAPIDDGTNGAPRTATETRPENVAVNIYVKL